LPLLLAFAEPAVVGVGVGSGLFAGQGFASLTSIELADLNQMAELVVASVRMPSDIADGANDVV
jgi:hypothetical protein